MIFKDRKDAGEQLAHKLKTLSIQDPLILAIPRGGIILGDVIAKKLNASLDIVISRKIGAPQNKELAIGALMQDGTFFPNSDLIQELHISEHYLREAIALESKEIERRLNLFRGKEKYALKDKTLILVDDGLATGATLFAAIKWVKTQHPKRIIVAIPVGPRDTLQKLSELTEVLVLYIPPFFSAVGQFYQVFDQVEDDEVLKIMNNRTLIR